MSYLDWGIVILYFIFTIILGILVGGETKSTKDYFLGGRNFKWWAIALSVIATQVSAITFIGAPGWAYSNGMTPLILNLNIPIVMWILSGTIIPFFYNSGVVSVYEYIEKRFGSKLKILFVIAYIFKMLVVVGSIVYVPSLILSRITGLSLNITIGLIVIVAIFYTILGGIQAVIWTDVVQMIFLWIGIAVSLYTAIRIIPESFSEIVKISKETGHLYALNFKGDLFTPNTFWSGIIGGGILHFAYFGIDQTQVQRVLTAKSIKNVKYSLWFSSIFLVIQMFLFLLIGVFLFVFYKGRVFQNPNDVFLEFILTEIPSGFLGIIIAAVFAATMSSIDSSLNSITTVFVNDIFLPLAEKKKWKIDGLKVTKYTTIFFGIIISYFSFIVSTSNLSILESISKYGSYILGPTLGIFLLGLYSRKTNELGGIAGFISGVVMVAYISNIYKIFWMWNNLVGITIALIVGYFTSCFIGKNSEENLLNLLIKEKKENKKEEGVYILPGKWEKKSYLLLAYFCIIMLTLLYIQK